MKASHLTTPRTLGDCAFTPSADPLTRYRSPGYSSAWWVAMICIAIVSAVIVWVTR